MKEASIDITVVGAIGIDTCVYLYGQDIDFNVEANFSQDIDYVGQAGGYASRLSKSLGRKTAFIGCVGDDFQGDFIRKTLQDDGIDIRALGIDPEGTHRSINLMYKDGRRKNFYDGRGGMTYQPDMTVCREILSNTKLVHSNIENWCRTLLPVAKESGCILSCDLQDVVTPDDPYRQDFINAADVLFFSSVNYPDPLPLMQDFARGNSEKIVICGRGKDGAAVYHRDEIRYYPIVESDTPVIDTNGAGDSLAIGFLTAYAWTDILSAMRCCERRSLLGIPVRLKPAPRN